VTAREELSGVATRGSRRRRRRRQRGRRWRERQGLNVSGREITFLPTYAFISWGRQTASFGLETPRFLSHCDESGKSRRVVVPLAELLFRVRQTAETSVKFRPPRHAAELSVIAAVRLYRERRFPFPLPLAPAGSERLA